MVGNLAHDVKIQQCITLTAGAAGATNINGSEVDTEGFEGVLFVFQFGPIVGTAVTSIKVQQDTVTGMGSAADLAGSGQTVADTDDDKVFYVDVKRPLERFLRPVVLRATANATVSCMAYLYRGRSFPVSHGTNVAGEVHSSPAEGTA